MTSTHKRRPPSPLDQEQLQALALHYAARYATTRAKLTAYLQRKLGERGWSDDARPAIEPLVEKLASLGYVDDEAFARIKSGAMQRRGLGRARIGEALRHAGIDADDATEALNISEPAQWDAAERLARRKRIGPFAQAQAERPVIERHVATFLRAGHSLTTARAWAFAAPDEPPPRPSEDDI